MKQDRLLQRADGEKSILEGSRLKDESVETGARRTGEIWKKRIYLQKTEYRIRRRVQ